jgi:hypothetical protein
LGNFHFEFEGSFEVGFVEAGEGSSGFAGFKLGAEHVVNFAVGGSASRCGHGGLVLGTVKAGHVVVDCAFVFDRYYCITSGDIVGERDSDSFVLLVIRDVRGRGDGCCSCVRTCG